MIKYSDLVKANESIKTTDIKGKKYAEVNQRIKAFRMVFPEGFIRTSIVMLEDGMCVIKAEVGEYIFNDGDSPSFHKEALLGTGIAYEKEDSSFINKTSYIENCETSAVGRALGMAGFGMDAEVASAEEQQNAMLNQTLAEKISDTQVKSIRTTIKEHPDLYSESGICNQFGVEKLEDLTIANLQVFLKYVNKHDDERSKENDKKGTNKGA